MMNLARPNSDEDLWNRFNTLTNRMDANKLEAKTLYGEYLRGVSPAREHEIATRIQELTADLQDLTDRVNELTAIKQQRMTIGN